MPITPTTTDTIEVGYIDDVDGYVKHVSVADANEYAKSNSDTAFIFVDGSGKTRYLSIRLMGKVSLATGTPLKLILTLEVME